MQELEKKRAEALSIMQPLMAEKDNKLQALAASAAQEINSLKSQRTSELSAQVAQLKKDFYNRIG